jgi:hypothetical protein
MRPIIRRRAGAGRPEGENLKLMSERITRLEDEKRRRQELAAFCRHATGVLELLEYALGQLNPQSQPEARKHLRNELSRLFLV